MNPPRDDEYDSLRDLMRGGARDDSEGVADDPAEADERGDLPPGVSAEYAEIYRRAYDRARRGDETGASDPEPAPSSAGEHRGEPAAAAPVGDEPTVQIGKDELPPAPPQRAAPPGHEPTQQIEASLLPADRPSRRTTPPAPSAAPSAARAQHHPRRTTSPPPLTRTAARFPWPRSDWARSPCSSSSARSGSGGSSRTTLPSRAARGTRQPAAGRAGRRRRTTGRSTP